MKDSELIDNEMASRGMVLFPEPDGHGYWAVKLSDGTWAGMHHTPEYATSDALFPYGDRVSHEWGVIHWDGDPREEKTETIGDGYGWDFDGALAALDDYIREPGWDRA